MRCLNLLSGFILGTSTHVFRQEPLRITVKSQPVLGLGKPVPLILEDDVLDLKTPCPHGLDELVRLRLHDARIVRALRDEHGDLDLVDAEER